MPDTQQYSAEVHVRTPGASDLASVYYDTSGPAGLPAEWVRADAEAFALAEIPDGTVVGFRFSTDGVRR